MAQEYAKRKLVTKLRKKDAPAGPQRADMPEYEDTTEYEQYQARDEEDVNEIDPETNLPYEDIPGVEESIGPDDLVGPGELKAGAALLKGMAAKGAPVMMLGSMAKTGAPKFSKVAQAEIGRIEKDLGKKLSEKEAQVIAAQVDKKAATSPGKEFATSVKTEMSAAPVTDRELQQEVIRNPELMKLRGESKEAAIARVQADKDAVARQAYALRVAKEQGSSPLPATKSYEEMLKSAPLGKKSTAKSADYPVQHSFQTDQRKGMHEIESDNEYNYSDVGRGIIKKIKKPESK